jgi:hypothetical protein
MKMNPIITQYKKMVLSLVAAIAMSASSALFAECKPCAAAAAIKQSIKDAQAAALAATGKPAKPKVVELDEINVQNNGLRCDTCEAGLLKISLAEVAAAALEAATVLVEELEELDVSADKVRAPREELVDICPCPDGDIDAKLQALYKCCVSTNRLLQCQGCSTQKCCNKLNHRIHKVKELIEDQIDDSEDCCSLLESLMVSQIDQSAECCSVIETVLGDPAVTIASLQDCFIDVLDFVNTNDDDVLTWLKRLYVLTYQIFSCQCCIE